MSRIAVAGGLLAATAAGSTTVSSIMTNTYALTDSECYPPAAEGGWGFCGAPTCKDQYITCAAEGGGPPTVDGVAGSFRSDVGSEDACVPFYDMSASAPVTDWTFKGACDDTCAQRTTGVCDAAFLEKVITGPSIKYAFCNDKWLVISSSGEGGVFDPNLNGVPSPPGASIDGTTYVTGDPTRTVDRYYSAFYPLDVVDHASGSHANNVDLFDGTSSNAAIPYAYSDGTGVGTYGLPDAAGVGMTVNGMQNWVTQNNRGEWNQPTCEASPCNLHVGQGAGQPHVHGDMFSDTHSCLYSSTNYTDESHGPIVGFASDGHLIYGRYVDADAPGFAAPLLDDCGGHTHDASSTDGYGVDLGATYH